MFAAAGWLGHIGAGLSIVRVKPASTTDAVDDHIVSCRLICVSQMKNVDPTRGSDLHDAQNILLLCIVSECVCPSAFFSIELFVSGSGSDLRHTARPHPIG